MSITTAKSPQWVAYVVLANIRLGRECLEVLIAARKSFIVQACVVFFSRKAIMSFCERKKCSKDGIDGLSEELFRKFENSKT